MTHLTQKISTPAVLGAGLMLTAGLLFAVINVLVQASTMQQGAAPATIAFLQYLVALIFCIPWILSRWRWALSTSRLPQHALRVVLAAAGVQLWIMGLAHVPIWQAVALIMTSPFFVTLGAGVLLKERVSGQRWLAVCCGFLGGMIILSPWSDGFTPAALYPLGAALLWALASLMTKHLTSTEKPETLTIYLLLLLTPINGALAANAGFSLPSQFVLLLVAAAGGLTAAAQYALAKSYQIADAAYLQPFDHVKLLFNVGLGWLAFGFLPDGNMWVGVALIVASSLYLLNNEARMEAEPASA